MLVFLLFGISQIAISQDIRPDYYMSPAWDVETRGASGSFTHHLDSLTGYYQEIWKREFEERMGAGSNRENQGESISRYKAESMSDHQAELRELFRDRIGPFPEKTPLNAEITGVVQRDGYRVEKVIFESRPSFFVTALFFLPEQEKFTPPYPAVLLPSGHYNPSKGHEEYQSMGALCALNGLAALAFDPVDQGERHQSLDSEGKPHNWGTRSHNLEGIRATLLGQHMAGYFSWDGIRALDYLCSREEVDADRIGVSGNSGGGMQTSYLFILDDRLKVAAPSCYIHTIYTEARLEMGDSEQNVFGQISDGLDHADYIMMRAPQPVEILAATHDFFRIYAVWDSYRAAKRYYTDLGYPERIQIMENNSGHNYNYQQREAAVHWMLRWLAGRDEVVREPEIELLTPEEYTCTPSGEVLLLPGARSITDLFVEELEAARNHRKEFLSNTTDNDLRLKIRALTGMDRMKSVGGPVMFRGKTSHEGYSTSELVFHSPEGYTFPGKYFTPEGNEGMVPGNGSQTLEDMKRDQENPPVVFLSEYGTSYHLGEIQKLVKEGRKVISVKLTGTGRESQKNKGFPLSRGLNWEDWNKAYLMSRSVVGYRTNDILYVCGLFGPAVELHSYGEPGIAAMHAALLDPEHISSIRISGSIYSWEDVVSSPSSFNQLPNAVFNSLNYYDIPDLVAMLGDDIQVSELLNVNGLPVQGRKKPGKLSNKPEHSGIAGVYYKSPGLINPEGPDWTETLDLSWDNKVDQRGKDWSGEWFGFLKSPYDGPLKITVSTDQSLELFLDDELACSISPLQQASPGERIEFQAQSEAVEIQTRKGGYVALRMKFTQDGPEKSFLNLEWEWEGKESHIIPGEYLYHSPRQRALMDTKWRQVDD